MKFITAGFICAQGISDTPTTAEILIGLHAQIKPQKAPTIKMGISSALYISFPYNLPSLPILWGRSLPSLGPDSLLLAACLCFQI